MPESRLSARCPVCGVVGSCCAVAPTDELERLRAENDGLRKALRDENRRAEGWKREAHRLEESR